MKRSIIYALCLAAVLSGFAAYTPVARADEDPSVQQVEENIREQQAAIQQQNEQFFQQQQEQQQCSKNRSNGCNSRARRSRIGRSSRPVIAARPGDGGAGARRPRHRQGVRGSAPGRPPHSAAASPGTAKDDSGWHYTITSAVRPVQRDIRQVEGVAKAL